MLPRIPLNSLAHLPGIALALVQLVVAAAEQVLGQKNVGHRAIISKY
jgi:hypothetical protein